MSMSMKINPFDVLRISVLCLSLSRKRKFNKLGIWWD